MKCQLLMLKVPILRTDNDNEVPVESVDKRQFTDRYIGDNGKILAVG